MITQNKDIIIFSIIINGKKIKRFVSHSLFITRNNNHKVNQVLNSHLNSHLKLNTKSKFLIKPYFQKLVKLTKLDEKGLQNKNETKIVKF